MPRVKATIIVVMIGILIAFSGSPGAQQDRHELSFPVSRSGVFDQSLAGTEPGARAWMSYSAVDPSPRWGIENSRTETIRLAYSDNDGAQWHDVGVRVNEVMDIDYDGRKGTWVNEVSSFVYDLWAPPEHRWQLYWHHYLSVNDQGEFAHGWIAYKGARTPEGLSAAPEVKLLSGRIYKPMTGAQAALTPVPAEPKISVESFGSGLNCLAFTEPGAMATPSGVYLSLQCVEPPFGGIAGMLATMVMGPKSSTVLLKCDAPCYPDRRQSWRYIGTALAADDARRFGFNDLVAPNLHVEADRAYLTMSPASNRPVGNAYNGCIVFAFDRIEEARLQRDAAGAPVIVRQVSGTPGSFNGACTCQPNVSASGFMYGEVDFSSQAPLFRIFQTGPLR
jgi:hypothetical protein